MRFLIPAAAAFALLPLTAGAQNDPDYFAGIDTNSDGRIDYAEHSASVASEFAEMDANGDGRISVNEYAGWLSQDWGGMADPSVTQSVASCFVRAVDTSGDGQISREEWTEYHDRVFLWLAGEDRILTAEESEVTPPPHIVPTPVCY